MVKAQDLREFFDDPDSNNINSYLDHCRKMGYKILQQEGLIVYGFGFIDDGIPSDILFLPGKIRVGQPFDEFIRERFSDDQTVIYDMIFATLRWRIPNLAVFMESLKHDTAILNLIQKQTIKLSYCKMTFNLFYGNIKSDYPADSKSKDVIILYNKQQFNIKCKQLPDGYGMPVYIEKLNF